jgi:hexosaminidase
VHIRPTAFLLGCLTALLLAALPGAAHASEKPAADRPTLIPAPARVDTASGSFALSLGTPLLANAQARGAADSFAALLATSHGLRLQVADAGRTATPAIEFAIDATAGAATPGSYVLQVDPKGVQVASRTAQGLFYGAQTLWQLLGPGESTVLRLQSVKIDDAPRFGWRGLMLDSARHFQSVDEIKRLLDAMAMHKLNVFHWHLTDDQGWRIEIKRYPRLTEVGGCRIPAGEAGVDPQSGQPRPYCGFYSQDQIREVVRYAAQRHIEVVPEIDVPGHAQAAIAAYPSLGVLGSAPPVSNQWGVHSYLFNTEESTFEFLEHVLEEVVDLFPGRYVHIGGDEAVKDQWEASARVQARMREVGAGDGMEMQSHLIKRLEKFLAAHDRRLIGWDEILEGGLPPEATVMSWRGIEGGIEAARQGHDVVMSPASDLYLDYLQTDSPNEPPGRPAMVTLRQVYAFEPVPAALTPEQRKHVLGVQANVWTEHMRNFGRVQHAVFPRIAALAETAWSPAARKDWEKFSARLPAQLQRYHMLGIEAAQTPFEVQVALEQGASARAARVSLSNPLGYTDIRYTVDGSTPTADSAAYTGPFELALPARLLASVWADGRALGPVTRRAIDASSLRSRSDEELAMCTGALMLRLEDDGPADGERAIFNVDIFNPCWEWKRAPLEGVAALQVRAGRIPYVFQLAHDEPARKFVPARSAHGELVVRGGCEGPELARVALPAQPASDGFVSLQAPLPRTVPSQDLCLYFTGDTRPTMWVLDRVTLQPAP